MRDAAASGLPMNRSAIYIASSVDGFVATADGGVKWLDAFHHPEGYDYDRFIRQCRRYVDWQSHTLLS